ncbi:hypothetical protein F4802DRAFT_595583 [Xylaria palmicola]|nr:hypothetical protein F4802DRAFT_595583 [Xylaria palmicola]
MASSKARNQFKWTGDAHVALAVALARMHGTITPAEQEALVKDMNDNGFETSWEGIRAITMSTPTKGVKRWDDRMEFHLYLSIYEVTGISLSQENKDAVVAMMNDRFGYDVSWNGIR